MDASPSLGLSVFAADAKEPSTASPAPADPSASPVGGVAPPVSYTNKTDEDFAAAAAQKAAAANDPDTRSTFELWAESDSSAYALAHFIQNAGFTHDPSYTLPPSGTQAWSDLTKGIPDDQLDRLSGAVSAQHAQFLADRIRSDDENEKEWQNGNHSKWGRLGLGLVDPANLALMLTGIGEANDASRVVRFLKGGAYAGAANAAFTGALGYLNGTPNAHAIAAAAIQGFALGGALHGILPPGETAAASNDIQNALRTTALNELSDHIDQGTVPEEAVHPAVLAEMRANDAAAAHAEAVESVHAELDSQRDSLVEVASGLTRQNDLRAATKELGDHESALTKAQADLEAVPEPKTAEDHLPDILDRMSNEDAVSYGDSADDPKIVKERTRAAKQEAADAADKSKAQYLADKGNAMDAVDNAEDRAVRQRAIVQRMRDAEQAQKDLRDHDTAVEKAQGDPNKLVQVIRDDATRAKLSEALKPPEELPNEAQASEVPVESPSGAGAHSMGAAEASDTMSPAVELDPAAVKVTKDVPQSSRAS
ncbi:MAG: hypothetical protein KGK08_14730, partial [Acidobacteriota bacterium]|nr:hypothetical protein [Acidobacteriota bacterium]